MSSFTLIFFDSAEAQDYSDIRFCDEFDLDRETLKCGKFDPPILFKSELIEFIHFTDFRFFNGQFIFAPGFIILTCPINIKTKFSIIEPGKILILYNWTS